MPDLHPDAAAMLEGLDPAAPPVRDVARLRRDYEAATAELCGEGEPVASVEDARAGGVPVRIYRPEGAKPQPTLVFLHGGGWILGSLDTHDPVCRALANAAGAVVVAVDYRLAPEHRFPAAVEDAAAATTWACENASRLGGDPARVAVCGDSAGGGLAAVVARRLGDRLAFQGLVYPVTDTAGDTESYRRSGAGVGLDAGEMAWFLEQYLGGADPANPDAAPLRAPDLSGCPPAWILVAEHDPLHDEAAAYAERLREAGVPTELVRYDGMIHGFFRRVRTVPSSRRAVRELAWALRDALR